MQSVSQRKTSVFGHHEWRVEPWQGVDKCLEQRVLDYGLMLGNLLERSDTLLDSTTCRFNDMADLLTDCTDLYNGIQHLQERFLSEPLNSHTKLQATTADMHHSPSASARSPEDIEGLVLSVTASGLQLAICATACDVIRRTERLPATPIQPGGIGSISVYGWIDADLFHTRRLAVAQTILRSATSALHEGVGVPGASRLAFPLRLASRQFGPSHPQGDECIALLQRLEGKSPKSMPDSKRIEPTASQTIRRKEILTCETTVVI